MFIKRKKSTVRVDRHTGRLRGRVPELHLCGNLNYFYGAFLLVFLWPIILICLVHSPYQVYLRILPCVCMHLSAKRDGSYRKSLWVLLASLPFDLQGAFLCTCSHRGLLTSRMRNMWSGQAQPHPLTVLLFSS